jgi:hypothetical protein
MGKSKVRVRRLTLPPSCDAARHLGNEGASDQFILQKEQFSRITEISIMAGEVSRPRPHLHGWNLLGDPNSGRPEKVMSLAFLLPKMIQCWLKRPWRRGFLWSKSGKQRKKLVSPSPDATKVSKQLKERSMAKKVIDVWVNNQRNKCRPWCGPLPPPRQSPLRTLGDALANAKIEKRRCSSSSVSQMDRRYTPPCHKILLSVQGAGQH